MSYKTLLTTLEEGIFTITINRPDKMNALNRDVIEELSQAISEVYERSDIRSAIITGAGEKAFVAGADISEFTSLDAAGGEALARKNQQLVFDRIEQAPKPIVAAVNGYALGGGCELALACHFILASENAKFGQPEVNLGLLPGYGGTQRLTQAVGKGRAMQLIMTGEMVSAQEAQQYGIANAVVPAAELLNAVKKILLVIHTKAPLAIARVIACINNFDHTQKGYDFEIRQFGECFGTADKVEGTNAFLEKRKPVFTGK
ncbi:enoyl-CoA hydratase/isomerase family protein [Filimonas effusa]|uniref:Enoyl-CoA hydratase n=1 Tax=Filimonas effusa TaxID=2508721 RepID=A0A4Q1D4B2_9BACT|nr:enoyl-CoA hydratase-related protein [Filimonas effusa]RXK83239.1 enoyl-CoA hydratase [Filimonas effusa]